MKAYVQFDDGAELGMDITQPDPKDGTFCLHWKEGELWTMNRANEDESRVWIRIDLEQSNLYVIAHDDYMGEGYDMYEFRGTYRELLEHMNHFFDDDDESKEAAAQYTDEQLIQCFNEANGDGQPYYTVWSVAEAKKILG